MKAITLHQPWASLVAEGIKTIETRSWSTSYRGPLAIHAAAKAAPWQGNERPWDVLALRFDHDGYDLARAMNGVVRDAVPLPLGAVVATCTLVDCVPIVHNYVTRPSVVTGRLSGTLWLKVAEGNDVDIEDQRPFGDFTPGRYAWLLDDIVKLDEPVPAKGAQRFWEWAA